jgi:hypothetical protein
VERIGAESEVRRRFGALEKCENRWRVVELNLKIDLRTFKTSEAAGGLLNSSSHLRSS